MKFARSPLCFNAKPYIIASSITRIFVLKCWNIEMFAAKWDNLCYKWNCFQLFFENFPDSIDYNKQHTWTHSMIVYNRTNQHWSNMSSNRDTNTQFLNDLFQFSYVKCMLKSLSAMQSAYRNSRFVKSRCVMNIWIFGGLNSLGEIKSGIKKEIPTKKKYSCSFIGFSGKRKKKIFQLEKKKRITYRFVFDYP